MPIIRVQNLDKDLKKNFNLHRNSFNLASLAYQTGFATYTQIPTEILIEESGLKTLWKVWFCMHEPPLTVF